MLSRRSRVIGLALAFLLGGCTAQVAAPRGGEPSPSAKPSPTNATTDVLYISASGSSVEARISVVDARTGTILRELPAGVLSRDRSTLYSTESLNGATQTRVRVSDLATGRELRSFTIEGYFRTVYENFVPVGPSADGRWVVLMNDSIKIDDKYVTRYAVVDTVGATAKTIELRDGWPYEFASLAPDGQTLYLIDHSPSAQPVGIRAYDVSAGVLRKTAVPGSAWNDWQANGWRSTAVASADGRWLFSVQGNVIDPPFVLALDTVNERARRIPLPAAQHTKDYEKAMLWSLVLSSDGGRLYTINPGVGAVNEIDTAAFTVRRTNAIPMSRASVDDPLAAVMQMIFPVAQAKRLLRSGAVLGPDGRTLYAAAGSGIVVIDTESLAQRAVLSRDVAYDTLVLSPDGERLYVITPDAWSTIAIIRTRDGSSAGAFRLPWYPGAILRVDLGR
jgi:hypothetical protein